MLVGPVIKESHAGQEAETIYARDTALMWEAVPGIGREILSAGLSARGLT